MMIEKIYIPQIPAVERRPGINTVTDRAVDLDVNDHSKKHTGHNQEHEKREEDAQEHHPAHPTPHGEKSRINVVA